MRILQTKLLTNLLGQQVNILKLGEDGLHLGKIGQMDIEMQGSCLTVCGVVFRSKGGGSRVVMSGYNRITFYGTGEYSYAQPQSPTLAYSRYYYAIARNCQYVYLSTPSSDYEWTNHE